MTVRSAAADDDDGSGGGKVMMGETSATFVVSVLSVLSTTSHSCTVDSY